MYKVNGGGREHLRMGFSFFSFWIRSQFFSFHLRSNGFNAAALDVRKMWEDVYRPTMGILFALASKV